MELVDEDRVSEITDQALLAQISGLLHVGDDDRPGWVGAYTPKGPGEPDGWARAHYRFYRSIVRHFMDKPGRVLDIGCGLGSHSAMLGRYSTDVVGIDMVQEVVDFANKHNAGPNVRFECHKFPDTSPAGPFDYVVIVEALEHVATGKQRAFLDAAVGLLSDGGRLIMTFPVA